MQPGGDKVNTKRVRRRGAAASFLIFALAGCGKIKVDSATVDFDGSTDFFASTIDSPSLQSAAPDSDTLKTGDGISLFYSDGAYQDQTTLSSGALHESAGSYAIEPDGRMIATTSAGTLRGAANPAEDFLYQIRGNGFEATQRLTLAASPFGFPAGRVPDFTGHYSFLGLRFSFADGIGFDLRESVRAISGTMSLAHDGLLTGSFFFTGSDSAGDALAFQGSFSLDAGDLTLHFFLDGAANEVWSGSFAPSGLLLLNDRSLGNGDAGSYAAVLRAGFQGPGPLVFDGTYSVAKLRFYTDHSTPFGTSVVRTLRDYTTSGVFSESCDLPFACPASYSGIPYTLNTDGTFSQDDPSLAGPVDGAISEDLGCFLAVEMGSSVGALPQEVALVVGVRLLQ